MTIDEAIRRIDCHNYIHQRREPRAIYITEAFRIATSIMRKYQKIKQILKEPCIIPEGCYSMLKRIKREVEDEKGD